MTFINWIKDHEFEIFYIIFGLIIIITIGITLKWGFDTGLWDFEQTNMTTGII